MGCCRTNPPGEEASWGPSTNLLTVFGQKPSHVMRVGGWWLTLPVSLQQCGINSWGLEERAAATSLQTCRVKATQDGSTQHHRVLIQWIVGETTQNIKSTWWLLSTFDSTVTNQRTEQGDVTRGEVCFGRLWWILIRIETFWPGSSDLLLICLISGDHQPPHATFPLNLLIRPHQFGPNVFIMSAIVHTSHRIWHKIQRATQTGPMQERFLSCRIRNNFSDTWKETSVCPNSVGFSTQNRWEGG